MFLHSESSPSMRLSWAWIPRALGILAVPLGIVGFWQHDLCPPGYSTIFCFFDWCYYTSQLSILHGGHLDPPVPLTLHLARFLAPAATLYGLYQTVRVVFKEPLRAYRLSSIDSHTVLVGDGPIARQFATALCTHGNTVMTVGSQELGVETSPLLQKHCLHVPSDTTATLPFDKLRLLKSRRVILAGTDDPANVATAVRLVEFFADQERHGKLLPCAMHLFDLRMRQLFAKHRLFEGEPGGVRLSTFNIYDNCARDLLERFYLDYIPIAADSKRVVRLVIVGFGKMGESLVLQAAKLGHFANGLPLEIVVFDQEAGEREASFLYRYQNFRKICSIEFRAQDRHSPQTVQNLARLLEDQDRIQTLAFCINEESLNVTVALDLFDDLRRLNVPALVRMSAEDGLTRMLRSAWDAVPLAQMLHPFNVLGPSVVEHLQRLPRLDELAYAIHEDFRKHRLWEGRLLDDPSMQPWEMLGPAFKESNRRAADHMPVKLRAIGCAIRDSSEGQGTILQPFNGFRPQEVEILARMEHASWSAERFLASWDTGDKSEKDRKNPYLVPWDHLPNEVQEWDREAVRNIPKLLANTGKSISR